jgi:acetylornithine deacetylase/succinyl-diaminopimelate desuccinylase-like protein
MSETAVRPTGSKGARVVEIARQLIRFDNTNPPGNELPCIEYVAELIRGAGLEPLIVAKDPQRPNLVVRLKGQQSEVGVLMHGHVDVVPTTGQQWDVAPFEARVVDDTLWGRGALDMKGGLAMMLEAILRLRDNNVRPPHDIVFAAFADQEEGSEFGATHLLESRPDLFDGVALRDRRDGRVFHRRIGPEVLSDNGVREAMVHAESNSARHTGTRVGARAWRGDAQAGASAGAAVRAAATRSRHPDGPRHGHQHRRPAPASTADGVARGVTAGPD